MYFPHSGIRLIVLAAILAVAGGCASRQESAISALHHFKRGNAAYGEEDYRGAVRHYLRALEDDDSSADIYYNLGLAYYQTAAWESSVAAFDGALIRAPTRPDIHYNLALAHHKNYDLAAANRHFNAYRDLVLGEARKTARANPPAAANIAAGQNNLRSASPTPAARQTAPNYQGTAPARSAPGGAGAADGPNPFQGNEKWWMQDLPAR